MTDIIDVQAGDNGAGVQAENTRSPQPTGRRGKLTAAGLIAATAVLGCVVAGQATSAAPPVAGTNATPAETDCLSEWPSIQSSGPLKGSPATPRTSHDTIPVHAEVKTGPGPDKVAVQQAILDFHPAPQVAGVDPTDAIALLSVTAQITDPTPWRTSRSIMLVAGEPSPGHPDVVAPRCPLADPALLGAMRDSGHPPLPEQVNPGQTVTGWVPVAVSRNAKWLALSLLREQANGSEGTGEWLMQSGNTR